ncbi:extracellular solute-binding protein [Virgibacillus halophilus]|uniref:Extracellular solute-binding protein n=1 Tax=Tigheibacillus halophilus TaxID=361280 RepID=A0ABU5C4S5_9BACI|nr:extracellular solute-binding protein [Virgibacillus halophilus]
MWITNQVPKEKRDAAWEFVKFVTKSDIQAEWAASTGYFPITPDAYDEDVLKKKYDEYPQYKVAVDQLQNTKVSPATQGPLTTVMPEARKIIESALGELYDGGDPKQVLDNAAKKITDTLK